MGVCVNCREMVGKAVLRLVPWCYSRAELLSWNISFMVIYCPNYYIENVWFYWECIIFIITKKLTFSKGWLCDRHFLVLSIITNIPKYNSLEKQEGAIFLAKLRFNGLTLFSLYQHIFFQRSHFSHAAPIYWVFSLLPTFPHPPTGRSTKLPTSLTFIRNQSKTQRNSKQNTESVFNSSKSSTSTCIFIARV